MSHHIFSTIITIPTGWTDFQYDDKGNVTLVTKPNSDTIEFQYYATGKRAKKIITAGTTVTTYKYCTAHHLSTHFQGNRN